MESAALEFARQESVASAGLSPGQVRKTLYSLSDHHHLLEARLTFTGRTSKLLHFVVLVQVYETSHCLMDMTSPSHAQVAVLVAYLGSIFLWINAEIAVRRTSK